MLWHRETDCPLTNRLIYRGSSQNTWTRQPVPMISEHSAHSTPLPFDIRTWLWRYTCLLLLISMLWHRQAIIASKGDKLSSSDECRIQTQGVSGTESPADWMPARWQTDWAIEDQAKTRIWQSVPMISEHSAHSTPLLFGIRTWLWRYTCLLFLISTHTHTHTHILKIIMHFTKTWYSSTTSCNWCNAYTRSESVNLFQWSNYVEFMFIFWKYEAYLR